MPRYVQPSRTVDKRGRSLRTEPMNVRMNAAERATIVRAAAFAGLPPSAYLRVVVLEHARRPASRQLPRWLPE